LKEKNKKEKIINNEGINIKNKIYVIYIMKYIVIYEELSHPDLLYTELIGIFDDRLEATKQVIIIEYFGHSSTIPTKGFNCCIEQYAKKIMLGHCIFRAILSCLSFFIFSKCNGKSLPSLETKTKKN
jgi:hypothetical protein